MSLIYILAPLILFSWFIVTKTHCRLYAMLLLDLLICIPITNFLANIKQNENEKNTLQCKIKVAHA